MPSMVDVPGATVTEEESRGTGVPAAFSGSPRHLVSAVAHWHLKLDPAAHPAAPNALQCSGRPLAGLARTGPVPKASDGAPAALLATPPRQIRKHPLGSISQDPDTPPTCNGPTSTRGTCSTASSRCMPVPSCVLQAIMAACLSRRRAGNTNIAKGRAIVRFGNSMRQRALAS
ncbi:hypothetical protein Micbo1qcDRAFT_173194 [Microdochium bolleyi]|uniref:Uncharacterized protein n=1 Tax=Microdochium bolleyi TaxID=196109 RepID=A0A136JB22_9PEZI|nr:hypothetical protein Micbo1qcDRAFT_173194 [Microdochium bolleyi]